MPTPNWYVIHSPNHGYLANNAAIAHTPIWTSSARFAWLYASRISANLAAACLPNITITITPYSPYSAT
tara:strand:- start:322 stop:528 length:207 start_codon:yes stop_codon:yes gene_type:complete